MKGRTFLCPNRPKPPKAGRPTPPKRPIPQARFQTPSPKRKSKAGRQSPRRAQASTASKRQRRRVWESVPWRLCKWLHQRERIGPSRRRSEAFAAVVADAGRGHQGDGIDHRPAEFLFTGKTPFALDLEVGVGLDPVRGQDVLVEILLLRDQRCDTGFRRRLARAPACRKTRCRSLARRSAWPGGPRRWIETGAWQTGATSRSVRLWAPARP